MRRLRPGQLAEDQRLPFDGDFDGLRLADAPPEDFLRERILQVLLDGAPQRTRPMKSWATR